MIDRVVLRVADLDASERFYRLVLAELGRADLGELVLEPATDERPPTRGLHLGFAARSRAEVDAFHAAGLAAGHPDDGAPGPRPEYRDDYYGGFLLDPDANSAEAVHHAATPGRPGVVDHLWIRVPDVAAARRRFVDLAPRTGFALRTDLPERVQFNDGEASFSLVAGGEPTRHVELHLRGVVVEAA